MSTETLLNSTMISNNSTYESIKDRTTSLIKSETVNEKELEDCAQELMLIPNLDDEIISASECLIDQNSFEIFQKEKENPIFIRNLLNIIQVINFVWVASKNNVDIFHKTLLNIGIMFSYLFRNEKDDNEGVDYGLLAPIPNTIYDFISKNGKYSFKSPDKFKFNEEIFSSDANDVQIGYIYKETSIIKIFSSFNPEKVTICPKIIYYMEHNSALKLFEQKIFDSPTNFKNLIYNEKEFNGYNEIDMSFFLNEKTTIKENNTFNIIKEKNNNYVYRSYDQDKPKDIIFEKDTNIFLELKTSCKNATIDDIVSKLSNMAQRFSFAYKNPAYSSLDKKFSKNSISYSVIYDCNRNNLVSQMFKFSDLKKEVEVYYNSVNAPISSIVSLQNQIRGVKKEITKLQEQTTDYQEQITKLQGQTTDYQEQITKLQEQMKEFKDKQELDMIIMNLKIFNLSREGIEKILGKCISEKSLSPLSDFEKYNQLFINASKILKKTLPFKDPIFIIDRVLSETLPHSEYLDFISLLNEKINQQTFAKIYYNHYKNAITGIKYVISDGKEFDYPKYSKEISDILKNILAFIYLLDKDPLLLNCFFASVLYYAFDVAKTDKRYSNFYAKLKPSEIDKSVGFFINSLNSDFYKE
jgi:hypothetical protein